MSGGLAIVFDFSTTYIIVIGMSNTRPRIVSELDPESETGGFCNGAVGVKWFSTAQPHIGL